VAAKKVYYLDELGTGDLVRCRIGHMWVARQETFGSTDLIHAGGLEALYLGGDGEDHFMFMSGRVYHVHDSHSESTRWEILGENN